MTLLRKTLSAKASQTKPRRGPFTRLERLWYIIFSTLFIDPFIALAGLERLHPDLALRGAILSALALLPFLAQDSLYKGIAALRNLNARQLERHQFLLPMIVGVILVLVVTLKVLPLGRLAGFWGLAFFLVVMVLTLQGVAQSVRKTWSHTQNLKKDAWARLELWENQLVLLSLAPQLLARSISLYGALSQGTPNQWPTFMLFFAVSLLFLGMLRPSRRLFMGFCRKCKQPVPIVFVDLGGCLQCDEGLRQSYQQERLNRS